MLSEKTLDFKNKYFPRNLSIVELSLIFTNYVPKFFSLQIILSYSEVLVWPKLPIAV